MADKRQTLKWASAILLVITLMLGVAAAVVAGCVWPEASGKKVSKDGSLVVDASHSSDGYIMVKASKSKNRLKLRVAKGDTTFTYDLNTNGEYEVFPLQLGSGSYSVTLYKNASGKKYSQAGKVSVKASLSSEDAAFLCPNQYVSYTANSKAVKLSDQVCAGKTTAKEKYKAIREYIKSNFMYDYIKSVSVTSGTMPDMDGLISSKMGICQDLAALGCCMLRVQGIPAEFVVGYANKTYHAWIVVHLDGEEILYDPTADCNGISRDCKYTVERYY